MASLQKYHTGLLIGRFQPFHKGHLYLIKKALKNVDRLIIGIGSTNVHDENNPLDFETRRKMVQDMLDNENLAKHIDKIIGLNDNPSDDVWFEEALKKTGPVDAIIGNNEWVNGIFEKKGYPILRLGLYKRHLFESKKIRQLIHQGKKWQDRVPKYLVPIISL